MVFIPIYLFVVWLQGGYNIYHTMYPGLDINTHQPTLGCISGIWNYKVVATWHYDMMCRVCSAGMCHIASGNCGALKYRTQQNVCWQGRTIVTHCNSPDTRTSKLRELVKPRVVPTEASMNVLQLFSHLLLCTFSIIFLYRCTTFIVCNQKLLISCLCLDRLHDLIKKGPYQS